jgi:Fe-S cluster biogenesis protein NfuA
VPQGACGTCAASTATMKMGIERALRSAFGDALKDVLQVVALPEPQIVRDLA